MAFSDHMDELRAVVQAIDSLYANARTASTGNLALLDSVVANLEPASNRGTQHRRIAESRSALARTLEIYLAMIDDTLTEIGSFVGAGSTDPLQLAQFWIPRYMATQPVPETIVDRDITRGAVSLDSVASGLSAGLLHSISTDRYGYPLQHALGFDSDSADFVVECVQDANQGATRGEERFRAYFAGDSARDALSNPTAGPFLENLVALDKQTGLQIVSNGGFVRFTGNAPSDWTTSKDSGGNPDWTGISRDTSDASSGFGYRPLRNTVSTGAAGTFSQLKWEPAHDGVLSQFLRRQINPSTPLFIAVRFIADGSINPDEFLQITLGSKSAQILPTSSYQTLVLGTESANPEYAWYEQFKETAGGPVQVKLTRGASNGSPTADLYIDAVFIVPRRFIRGRWIAIEQGPSGENYTSGDRFTATDSVGTRGKISYWIQRRYNASWPSATDANQITASGGRTLTFADDDPDTITASSGDFVADGYKPGMLLTVAGTSNNNGTYTIANVTDTVITLIASDELTNEGPLSSAATLDATASVADPS